MAKTKTIKRCFRIREGDFKDAYTFVEGMLTRKDVNVETAKETLLVFEALMQKIVDWGLDEKTDVEISGTDRLGEFRIEVAFEGKVFATEHGAAASIEDRILDAHDDKLGFSYHSGCNVISLSVSRSHRTSLFACVVASLCAIVIYIPLSSLIDTSGQQDLLANYVFPLERVYANAMLMIGAPMTFFSLLKNLTDTYVVSRRSSGLRRLQARTFATSAFAILLAFGSFFLISIPMTILMNSIGEAPAAFNDSVNLVFADVVTSFVTPSIFEPFEAVSPIPLMAVALLCTYALCSAGKYFDSLRHAMMACYTLFSRMLHVVIAALPVFCFLAVMDLLLEAGFVNIIGTLIYFVAATIGIMLLFATYAIRLRAHGIKVVPFVQKIIPLLRENLKIGSAINAAPYNTRYCSKVLKMDRERLERNLPVLAEINLDGNCFLLGFFALAFAFIMGAYLSWFELIGLAMLILFLSLGAPNQPGSILIGMLIITIFLGSYDALCTAIVLEAFFGSAQNLVNIIGDIVLAAIEDHKEKALAESA